MDAEDVHDLRVARAESGRLQLPAVHGLILIDQAHLVLAAGHAKVDPAEDSTPSPRLETSDIAAKAMTLESLLSKDAPQKTFLPFLVSPVFFYPANTAGGPFFSFVNRE
eukprot:scaffold132866_cov63-Phaeocystis_antarctica.AAC.2